jgi:hypothetical protein
MSSGYVHSADVLQHRECYQEKGVQAAILELWSLIFGSCWRVTDTNMSTTWQPDIVALNKAGTPLIIEAKGKPPSGSRGDAISQVVRYASEAWEEFPDTPLKLIVIGPWDRDWLFQTEEVDGPEVCLVNVMLLGEGIAQRLERMVRWCIESPFQMAEGAPALAGAVSTLAASTGEFEEDGHGEPNEPDEAGGADGVCTGDNGDAGSGESQ